MLHSTSKEQTLARLKRRFRGGREFEAPAVIEELVMHPNGEYDSMNYIDTIMKDLKRHYRRGDKQSISKCINDLCYHSKNLQRNFKYNSQFTRPIDVQFERQRLKPTPPSLYNEFAQNTTTRPVYK